MCQAALNGDTIDSAPATIDVRYLRQPHVVDTSGQGPILIASQVAFAVRCFFHRHYSSKIFEVISISIIYYSNVLTNGVKGHVMIMQERYISPDKYFFEGTFAVSKSFNDVLHS